VTIDLIYVLCGLATKRDRFGDCRFTDCQAKVGRHSVW